VSDHLIAEANRHAKALPVNPDRLALALALQTIDELERENATLREKDEDWENAVLHARDHRCDEAHCTCVVPLLGKINQLERENSALREQLINVTSELTVTKANALAHKERLERENAALKQRILDDNKAYGCELRDPSGTIWDHAKQLQAENAALRAALDQQANYQRDLRADRDRLDWVCEHLFTTRSAIDAKLEKEAQP
jgi:Mg2+ and Co2+ transporter CorA